MEVDFIDNVYVSGLAKEVALQLSEFAYNNSDNLFAGKFSYEGEADYLEVDTFETEDGEEVALGLNIGIDFCIDVSNSNEIIMYFDGTLKRYDNCFESDYKTCYTGQRLIEEATGMPLIDIISSESFLNLVKEQIDLPDDIICKSQESFDPWDDLGNTHTW